jgi:hypothetical protein
MKNRKRISVLGLLLFSAFVLLSTSCKKEKVAYQTKVRNSCETTLLGLPFMKYDIKEFKLGEISFTNIANGNDSEYKGIESDTEYPITITYDAYFYNADNSSWEYDKTYTEDLGTETWSDSEDSDKFIIKVKVGDVLQAYKPIYTVYIAN